MSKAYAPPETGKLVVNREGHTAGPEYGQVYTAPRGQRGYIAGYCSHANRGLGLLEERSFPTLAEAEQYLAEHGWY